MNPVLLRMWSRFATENFSTASTPRSEGRSDRARHIRMSISDLRSRPPSMRSLSLCRTGRGRISRSPEPLSGPSCWILRIIPIKNPLLLLMRLKFASENRCMTFSANSSPKSSSCSVVKLSMSVGLRYPWSISLSSFRRQPPGLELRDRERYLPRDLDPDLDLYWGLALRLYLRPRLRLRL